MKELDYFYSLLASEERKLISELNSPRAIQDFLDLAYYPATDFNRSPIEVLREKTAHCLDGGLFAAVCLRCLGYPPLILDLLPAKGKDDDHIVALFKIAGCWGAVAKSNYSGLRYREPIHRTVRELALSYFENFYNVLGEKTLRSYTRQVDLSRFDASGWMWKREGVDRIEGELKKRKQIKLLTESQEENLSTVDKLSYQAGLIASNPDGLYQPGEK